MRIEICGGIASGKTTLANSLKEYGFCVANEKIGGTSFLDEFYSNPELFTFETEISFLLQHSVEIKKCLKSHKIVCDFSFEQDYAYAVNNMNASELQTFKSVFNEVKRQLSEPDLIIKLECSTATKQERIRFRGRDNEQMIKNEYLENMDALIIKRISNLSTPTICINTEKYDFRKTDVIKSALFPLIQPYLLNCI